MKNQKSVFTPVARLALAGLLAGTLAMPLAASAALVGAAMTSITGKVMAVDEATRTVTVQGENGNTVEIVAGPEVRNFKQIKPGNNLTFDYYESVGIDVRPAGSGIAETKTVTEGARTPKGSMPAGAVGRKTTITAEIWHINKDANLVTLKGPQGGMRTIQVQDPAMQAKLQQLKVGDLVDFTVTQALGVAVHK